MYVPAFVDSEIGNDVYVHNVKRRQKGCSPVLMDLELDTANLIELVTGAKKIGIFTVGGRFSEVHADAAQVWPFLVKYVMEARDRV